MSSNLDPPLVESAVDNLSTCSRDLIPGRLKFSSIGIGTFSSSSVSATLLSSSRDVSVICLLVESVVSFAFCVDTSSVSPLEGTLFIIVLSLWDIIISGVSVMIAFSVDVGGSFVVSAVTALKSSRKTPEIRLTMRS